MVTRSARYRPSPAIIVACIALIVAMGGTGYAALKLQKNSVGSREIKRGAVRSSEIARNAVRSRQVKNRSLLVEDFKPGQIPKGTKGDTGQTGPTGPAGPFLDVLPSGKTLRGTYAASGTAGAAGETVRDAPSFAFPVPADWTANIVPPGGPPTSACAGDVNSPEAAPGNLCVYQGFNSNATLVVDSAAATGSDRFGWIAQITSNGAGDFQSRGTWAITAP